MDPILFEIVAWVDGFAAVGSAVGVLVVLAGWCIVTRVAAWFKR
jgi:hypothetical protein